jgi:nucleoside-diphosphate-sugar epimerase
MKILVTGHKGYIGVHLVSLLKKEGHEVTGCDIGLFEGCNWEPIEKPHIEIIRDFRALEVHELRGYDCLMHLAAISNDPMGELDPEITFDVNGKGSINLAKKAKEAGIKRFLFSGSCSIYGQGKTLDLDESANFNPVSAYAMSKIEAEKGIRKLADGDFSPIFLRNATAYGHSPMLRLDLVANNLLASAFTLGEIRIKSDGTPWRPLVHCEDIASAFIALLRAPTERIHNRAINIGHNSENYQVKDISGIVQRLMPDAKVVFTGEVGSDPRNYRVNFDLLKKTLPDFTLKYSLDEGMDALFERFNLHQLSLDDFEGERFYRLKILKKRLHLLNASLALSSQK